MHNERERNKLKPDTNIIQTDILSLDGLGRLTTSYMDLKRNMLMHLHPDGHYLDSRIATDEEISYLNLA